MSPVGPDAAGPRERKRASCGGAPPSKGPMRRGPSTRGLITEDGVGGGAVFNWSGPLAELDAADVRDPAATAGHADRQPAAAGGAPAQLLAVHRDTDLAAGDCDVGM